MWDCPEHVNVVKSCFSNLPTPTSSLQWGFRPQHHDTVQSLCLLLRLQYHGLFVFLQWLLSRWKTCVYLCYTPFSCSSLVLLEFISCLTHVQLMLAITLLYGTHRHFSSFQRQLVSNNTSWGNQPLGSAVRELFLTLAKYYLVVVRVPSKQCLWPLMATTAETKSTQPTSTNTHLPLLLQITQWQQSYRLTRRTHANTKLTPLNAWLVIFFQICHSNLPKTSSNAQITTNTFRGVFCWTMDPPCRTCPMKTFCPASKNSIVNGFRGRTLHSQRWPKQSRRTGIWYTKWRARCSQETSLTI